MLRVGNVLCVVIIIFEVTTVLSISKCCEDECALASRNETMCVNTAPNEEECDASFYGLCSCIWEPANSTCYAVFSGLEEQQDTVVGLDKKRDLEAKRIDVLAVVLPVVVGCFLLCLCGARAYSRRRNSLMVADDEDDEQAGRALPKTAREIYWWLPTPNPYKAPKPSSAGRSPPKTPLTKTEKLVRSAKECLGLSKPEEQGPVVREHGLYLGDDESFKLPKRSFKAPKAAGEWGWRWWGRGGGDGGEEAGPSTIQSIADRKTSSNTTTQEQSQSKRSAPNKLELSTPVVSSSVGFAAAGEEPECEWSMSTAKEWSGGSVGANAGPVAPSRPALRFPSPGSPSFQRARRAGRNMRPAPVVTGTLEGHDPRTVATPTLVPVAPPLPSAASFRAGLNLNLDPRPLSPVPSADSLSSCELPQPVGSDRLSLDSTRDWVLDSRAHLPVRGADADAGSSSSSSSSSSSASRSATPAGLIRDSLGTSQPLPTSSVRAPWREGLQVRVASGPVNERHRDGGLELESAGPRARITGPWDSQRVIQATPGRFQVVSGAPAMEATLMGYPGTGSGPGSAGGPGSFLSSWSMVQQGNLTRALGLGQPQALMPGPGSGVSLSQVRRQGSQAHVNLYSNDFKLSAHSPGLPVGSGPLGTGRSSLSAADSFKFSSFRTVVESTPTHLSEPRAGMLPLQVDPAPISSGFARPPAGRHWQGQSPGPGHLHWQVQVDPGPAEQPGRASDGPVQISVDASARRFSTSAPRHAGPSETSAAAIVAGTDQAPMAHVGPESVPGAGAGVGAGVGSPSLLAKRAKRGGARLLVRVTSTKPEDEDED